MPAIMDLNAHNESAIWVSRQAGTEIEVSKGGAVYHLPLSCVEVMVREIVCCADAFIMDWNCISAVGLFLSEIEKQGWIISPPDARTPFSKR
jgi:hypothetical protein